MLIGGLGFSEIGGLMVVRLSRRVVLFRLSRGIAVTRLGRSIAILRPSRRTVRFIVGLGIGDAFAHRLPRKLILEFFAIG